MLVDNHMSSFEKKKKILIIGAVFIKSISEPGFGSNINFGISYKV